MQGGQEFQSLTMFFLCYCFEMFGTLLTPSFCKLSMMPVDKKIKNLLQIEEMYMHPIEKLRSVNQSNVQ